MQQAFAVLVLPGRRYPDLIKNDDTLKEDSFVALDAAPADVLAAVRAPADPTPGAAASAGSGCSARALARARESLFVTRGC
jgi:hypothetical protein